MANPKKDQSEYVRSQLEKLVKEEEERKQKAWEAFAKLSSQEKIEHLWKHIYQLEQVIDGLNLELEVCHGRIDSLQKRDKDTVFYVDDLDSRDEEVEKLASLRYFGQIDWECPQCHHCSVERKRSSTFPTEKYILKCSSCGWREERKFPTDY